MAYYVDQNGNPKKVLSVVRLAGKFGVFDGTGKTYGTYYALNEGLDGYGKVIYTAIGYDKWFIEGSSSLAEYGIDENISNVCAYALSSFTALEKCVLYNEDEVVDIDPNAFINTPIESGDGEIFVPDNFLSQYVARYNTQMGKSWVFDTYTNYSVWTIPYIDGVTPTTLTAQYIAEELEKNKAAKYAKKVVIPSYFTEYESGVLEKIESDLADFEEIESPWLNGKLGVDLELSLPIAKPASTTLTKEELARHLGVIGGTIPTGTKKLSVLSGYTLLDSQAFTEIGVTGITELNLRLSNYQKTFWDNTDLRIPFPNLKKLYLSTYRIDDFFWLYLPASVEEIECDKLSVGSRTDGNCLINLDENPMLRSLKCNSVIKKNNSSIMNQIINRVAPYLETVWLGDISAITSGTSPIFSTGRANSATDIKFTGMNFNCSINASSNISHDSLVYIMEHAYDYSGDSGTHTWTIGADNIAKLSQAEIDAFTARNWTIA